MEPRTVFAPLRNSVSTETIWYMHNVIMGMNLIVPFANAWETRTGFNLNTTQSDILTALNEKETEQKCLAAWREFCHICLDYLSVT